MLATKQYSHQKESHIDIGEYNFELVEQITYLSILLTANNNSRSEIHARILLAQNAMIVSYCRSNQLTYKL